MNDHHEVPAVFTIGHSNHTVGFLLGLLGQHGVTAVADVRSTPYSKLHPDFNREALQLALRQVGIEYVLLGDQLGARPNDAACYESGRVRYERLARRAEFRHGLQRISEGCRRYRIAVLCAESDPLACHRTLVVARELVRLGLEVVHIRGNGELETQEAAMERLLIMFHLEHPDMFHTRLQLIDEACNRQEQRIAYVNEDLLPAASPLA